MYKTRMATEDILVYVFSLPSLLVMKKTNASPKYLNKNT